MHKHCVLMTNTTRLNNSYRQKIFVFDQGWWGGGFIQLQTQTLTFIFALIKGVNNKKHVAKV